MSPINFKKDSPEFSDTMLSKPKTRRTILKSIATGMTVTALSGCVKIRKPKKIIKTYTNDIKDLVPGVPNFYATSHQLDNTIDALVVKSYEGRPVKIDGNPRYASSKGGSSAFVQAELNNLYDPDRLNSNKQSKSLVSRQDVIDQISTIKSDVSLGLVLPNSNSIALHSLVDSLQNKYNNLSIYCDQRVQNKNESQAILESTGSPGYLNYNFNKTQFILSFNHDFLGLECNELVNKREYVKHQSSFSYVSFSDSLSLTDSKADNVIKTSIDQQTHIIFYIAANLIQTYGSSLVQNTRRLKFKYDVNAFDVLTVDKIIKQLIKYRQRSIVSVGAIHDKNVHKAVLLINSVLKNMNQTVSIYKKTYDLLSKSSQFKLKSMKDLDDDLIRGSLNTIISLDVDFSRFINKIEEKLNDVTVIFSGFYSSSLSKLSDLVIAKSHFLESWDCFISKEGHVTVQQPLIERLYDTFTTNDILNILLKGREFSYGNLVRLVNQRGISMTYLKQSGVLNYFYKIRRLSINSIKFEKTSLSNSSEYLTVLPSHSMYDGRYSNNSWLLETPDPITKLTWGNAIIVSSEFAKQRNLVTGQFINVLLANDVKIKSPVIILPGQDNKALTISFGFGNVFNTTFSNYGVSCDQLIPFTSYDVVSIQPLNEKTVLADTQMNHGLDEEKLAASGIKQRIKKILKIQSTAELNSHDDKHSKHKAHSLFKELKYDHKYQWGMSFDLNACIGCSACAISCMVENNIPVVGKKEVIRGREMSWLRIDRYYIENDNHEQTINFMPLACVHCENAPCEQVCPVNATVHDDQGLNVMVYNRCIGTRYCANNCPYKVRRFNFFDWHQKNPQSVEKDRIHLFDYFREPAKTHQMQFNPEVTVRMRGVMEKCTYCVQRLRNAQILAKNNSDESYIKNIKTACQDACATGAISFGNINDKTALISKKRKSKRRYDLLNYELNTKPRTIYLSKIVNPVLGSKKKKKEAAYGHS